MGLSTEEKKRLNKEHPDYKKFCEEIKVASEKYTREYDETESKYEHPLSLEDIYAIAHETRACKKAYNNDVRRIMEKYEYLYE